jgi:Fic family protein
MGHTISQIWQADPTINAPPKYRRACRYDAYVPGRLADLDLRLQADVAGVVAEADAAVRELNAFARPALAPLARLLLRTESIASSKVEGMQMGLRDLARAEAKMESGAAVGSTVLEIVGNINAMELAIEEAISVAAFGPEQILAIHDRLLERANPRIAGRFRTVQNWIGGNDYNPCGADFVPPPPEYLGELIADLCTAVSDDLLPPLVQAALVHAQFETIHPFDDGNGRTGRALIHVVLRRRGVAPAYVPPISVMLANSRDRYIRGLTRYREGGIEEWIEQFAAAAASSARLAAGYLQEVKELSADWNRALAASPHAPREDAAAWALLEQLPAWPIITAPVAAAATRRSRPQIYKALEQLQAAGVLIPLSSGKRNRSWEASGLLDLLDGLAAGTAPQGPE